MTSHEFRTPLTGILSAAEVLEHYGPRWTEDKRLRYLHQIQASVSNLTKLLDVLIIGRARMQALPFAPVPLDLDRLCADLTEEVQLSTQQHTIIYTAPADLGLVHMDQNARHILTNLLSNAVKYSPRADQSICGGTAGRRDDFPDFRLRHRNSRNAMTAIRDVPSRCAQCR
ncbi:MAG: histidine kinase dimerization/phospho-acceptor domain-containing protein [Anaerolineae bacterium]